MTTETQNKVFGLHKKYGVTPVKQKPKRGNLVSVIGGVETILYENQPFGFLQFMKKEYIEKRGWKKENLKIRYYYGKSV